ncbi:SCO family protein [Mangrovicoccus sp. HB161399]|uniref:SCO family protein n=1 Tax=Mangrovicoccus sp. HB161399 TaxID=2720392 RepID=UPI001552A3E3|nr:SCO family protein [Mangrovicoccus sp. HB161399]
MIRLLAALLLAAAPAAAQVQGVLLDDPVEMPSFALDGTATTRFSDADLQGRWTLVMFGYNSCPDVCPFTMQNLEAAWSETSLRVRPDNIPQVVFVSVDPERDRETVADYAVFFHPDFLGVTGRQEDIDRLVEASDSFYRLMPPDSSGYYEVQHSSSVLVIAPDGTLRAKLQPPFDPGRTAEFLSMLQIQYRREMIQ